MVDISNDYIPTFVKAGSFVPMAKHLKKPPMIIMAIL